MKFVDLEFKPMESTGGTQAVHLFPNGYGISAVNHSFSYTTGPDEYEVAIIEGTPEEWDLAYDTDITNDVLGYQTAADIDDLLERVSAL